MQIKHNVTIDQITIYCYSRFRHFLIIFMAAIYSLTICRIISHFSDLRFYFYN